jgi:hypothetical protein
MDGPTSRAGEIYTELRTLPRGESAKQENSMPMLPSGRHIAITLTLSPEWTARQSQNNGLNSRQDAH